MTSPRACAHQILDVAPMILQSIRGEMRRTSSADLTVTQFRTLLFLNRNPGASLSAAAEHIGLTLSSMSILVNTLVDRELVARATAHEDRRRIHLTVTQAGRILLERSLQETETYLANLVVALSEEERAVVVAGLELLRPVFAPSPTNMQRERAAVHSVQHAIPTEGAAAP